MRKYSFYAFTLGQVLFVLLVEILFFQDALMASLMEHVIMATSVYVITAASFFISKKMINSDPRYLIHTVIGSTTVKLILYVSVIAALLYFFSGPRKYYIFFFFISYLLVTTTEILSLVRTLKRRSSRTA